MNSPWTTRSSAKTVRLGAKASERGRDRQDQQAEADRALALDACAERADQQPGDRHAKRAGIGGDADLGDAETPYDAARLGRIACVANRSTSVRKPMTPISSELRSGNPGICGAAVG